MHGATEQGWRGGFSHVLAELALDRGVSAYIGDGTQRWPAVHRLDAARLFRLALEHAPAGSLLHVVGDEGIPCATSLDQPATSARTRELLDWQPRESGLLVDIAANDITPRG